MSWLWSPLQGLVLLAFAPFFLGWVNWWEARLTGRKRPLSWVLQPYRDWFRLFFQAPIWPETASWIFRITPSLLFVVYGSLLFTIPLFASPLLPADLLLAMYLLGLGRFTLSLAGLDSGSSFGNLGSNREMFFHFLTETSLFLTIAAAWVWAELPTNIAQPMFWLASLAILAAFFPVILLEALRRPVENPETHLELTMAGKAVKLEFSGRHLALLEWGETSKFFFLIIWLSQWMFTLLLSQPIAHSWVSWSIFMLQLGLWLLIGIGLAFWERQHAKLRLGRVPQVAQVSLFLSLFALLLRLIPGE